MLAEVEKVNNQPHDSDVVIGSADVKALYPSLDLKFVIEVVCQEFHESNVKVDGIDHKEVGLYVALNTDTDRQCELGIESFCPKRRHTSGRTPTITASGVSENIEERYKPWIFPESNPNNTQHRIMLVEAIRIALKEIFYKHIYIFDGTLRKQASGGAIGLQLTGTIAQIFMRW